MAKKRFKISIKDLEKILSSMIKIKVEKDNNSWGDCRVHYDECVLPSDVMYHVRKFLEKDIK